MRSALSFSLKILGFVLLAGNAGAVEYGARDPEFNRVPFEEWLNGRRQGRINWSLEISSPELTAHQRMLAGIRIGIDGRELEKRRNGGEFVAFLQLQDNSGHVWQNHTALDLDNMQSAMQSRNILIAQYAFLLPGDYNLAAAVWHSASGEHSLIRRKIHVSPIGNDPLPNAWNGLPSVEFIQPGDTPDIWYLPDVVGNLQLPAPSARRVQVEILVNATAGGRSSGSLAALRRNMSLLIPALKVMCALRLQQGSVDVSLLDLERRRNAFTQKDVRELDWARLRTFFSETNPAVVDVQTLANEWKMRAYFQSEIARRMSAQDGTAHLIVVLSGSAFMGDQAPVENEPYPVDRDHRLIYVRYRPDPLRYFSQRRFRPGARPMPPPIVRPMPVDDLEKSLEPLHARLFDATSAEQFRRILAAVIDEIAHL